MQNVSRMSWQKLLSTKRVSALNSECSIEQADISPRKGSQFKDARTEFERDSDQLIYSSQFRRLQDKTQVIPFPEYDFVHTRLTHTLEVSAVGRSLGRLAGEFLKELAAGGKEALPTDFDVNDIAEIVRAACLAHDIGNPPFGHSGEDSISHYFTGIAEVNWKQGPLIDSSAIPEVLRNLSDSYDGSQDVKRAHDLLHFEGNANGFRIMTQCKNKALNPTCATLGAFSKYPRESALVGDPDKQTRKYGPKSQSKYGFFQTERELFESIANELGLIPVKNLKEGDLAWKRHPLAFLMEAADDICYKMIDFEDGCRLRLINFREIYDIPAKDVEAATAYPVSPKQILLNIAKIDDAFNEHYTVERSNTIRPELAFLRSKAINVLTHLAFDAFRENYAGIMDGTFDKALVDCIANADVIRDLKAMDSLIKEYVYKYTPVLESEAAGFKVIGGLLHSFADTAQVCKSCNDPKTAQQEKLEALLPVKYRPQVEEQDKNLDFKTKHSRYLNIIDYVSGMTDGFAMSLYRKLEGIALPEIR